MAALFLFFGTSKLSADPSQVALFKGWGYPLWFMFVVGSAEVAGGLLLLYRGTAFYGGLVVAGLMVGGVATHATAGQWMALPLPLVTGGLATLITVFRRHAWTRDLSIKPESPAGGGRA